ncbi:MAG TPA: SURF1 family protein, partial [Arachnia sp.]|nr:SURF1 family protein [Arachnia sp.]
MPARLKQILVGVVGCAVAVTMLWLGLWQMRVYESKEQASAEERAALPPIALLENVAADGTVGDVYGRQVSASGAFLSSQQLILTDGRVLTAFELADGRVLPVVRGTLPEPDEGPSPPPSGEQRIVGVFMPTEPRSDDPDGAVRLAGLAQLWPQQLLPGFLTLDAEGAHAHGLAPATVDLGTGEGSWQNYGYALQWWVFA